MTRWLSGVHTGAMSRAGSAVRRVSVSRSDMSPAKRPGASGWRASVTSTSALRRGRPYTVTACAPKTYQRPQRARTGDSAVSSSTAAGCTGTAEGVDQAYLSKKVLLSILRGRPGRVPGKDLPPQLVSDAQPLDGPETRDGAPQYRSLLSRAARQSRFTRSRIPRMRALYRAAPVTGGPLRTPEQAVGRPPCLADARTSVRLSRPSSLPGTMTCHTTGIPRDRR
jgi:hypothetical protein